MNPIKKYENSPIIKDNNLLNGSDLISDLLHNYRSLSFVESISALLFSSDVAAYTYFGEKEFTLNPNAYFEWANPTFNT